MDDQPPLPTEESNHNPTIEEPNAVNPDTLSGGKDNRTRLDRWQAYAEIAGVFVAVIALIGLVA